MEGVDSAAAARGRLAVLSAHLGASVNESEIDFSSVLERRSVSAQNLHPPTNLKGAITIIDERTLKKYQIPVSEDGTIKATDLKNVKFLFIFVVMDFSEFNHVLIVILHVFRRMIFYLPLAFFGKSNVKIMKKVDEEFELWEGGLEIIDCFSWKR